ncbi:hypothetical protein KYD97_05415 [Listeria monocytogenes]|uniref:hypothetical protein n=1 Tax=Listeria monocytogenes TaxID=1639 RepID=UPI001E320326|nr:hypothetical protein [Listeria monocytogenes]MCD7640689.1 hypothetical protein [Listeria monocytogenes]
MNLFEEELAEAKEMVIEFNDDEILDALRDMNIAVREHTHGVEALLDEFSRRKKQNKEEK